MKSVERVETEKKRKKKSSQSGHEGNETACHVWFVFPIMPLMSRRLLALFFFHPPRFREIERRGVVPCLVQRKKKKEPI